MFLHHFIFPLYYLHTGLLTLILINVQYLRNVVFSFEKSSNGQHHSTSDSSCPIEKFSQAKFLIPSTLQHYYDFILIRHSQTQLIFHFQLMWEVFLKFTGYNKVLQRCSRTENSATKPTVCVHFTTISAKQFYRNTGWLTIAPIIPQLKFYKFHVVVFSQKSSFLLFLIFSVKALK